MDPVVRAARPADLPGMLALYRELRPGDPPWPGGAAQPYFDWLIEEVVLVVAECEGVLAATCMLAFVPQLASGGRPIGLVEHVVTLPHFRGRGLAAAVLRHALAVAWEHDAAKVLLLSGAQRIDAHRVYEAVGFRGDVERGFVAKPPVAKP